MTAAPVQGQEIMGGRLPARYGRLGGTRGEMLVRASKLCAFWFGKPGDGKSALLQSNPDLFIINTDGSSTTSATPVATMWPGVNQDGQMFDDDGKPLILTFEAILRKAGVLIDMAKNGEPRPEGVAIDSLASLQALALDWVTRNAKSLALAKGDGPDIRYFRELHGPSAWGTAYDAIVELIANLKNAGYGVHITGHTIKNRVQYGPDQFKAETDLMMGDGLWKRLFYYFSLSLCVESSIESFPTIRDVKTVIRGVESIKKEHSSENRRVFRVISDRGDLSGLLKCRHPLPDIILPRENAWAHFERIYMQSAPSAKATPHAT